MEQPQTAGRRGVTAIQFDASADPTDAVPFGRGSVIAFRTAYRAKPFAARAYRADLPSALLRAKIGSASISDPSCVLSSASSIGSVK